MTEDDTETYIVDPEVMDEILRNTDSKNRMRKDERILRKSLAELVKSGHATFLFLRDDEVSSYWAKICNAAAKIVKERREAWRVYNIKRAAWERLSEEDRKVLKITKPIAPRI